MKAEKPAGFLRDGRLGSLILRSGSLPGNTLLGKPTTEDLFSWFLQKSSKAVKGASSRPPQQQENNRKRFSERTFFLTKICLTNAFPALYYDSVSTN